MRVLIIVGTILLILFFMFLYMAACYYIGLKGRNIFLYKNKKARIVIYWAIFWFLALSYIISVLCRNFFSVNSMITSVFTTIGTICLAITCYLVIVFPIIDIIRLILKKAGYRGKIKNYLSKLYGNGIAVFIGIFIIVAFGVWNAAHPVVTNYNININKDAGKIKLLNAVVVSDVHMGIGIKESGIDKMVESINKLNPDVVFFCGDIVDESTTSKLKEYFSNSARNIKSKYGIYAITGNHEYLEDNLPETLDYFKKGNIDVIQDNVVKIADSFYVVGRNDPAGQNVKPLNLILKNVDKSMPIIVLNHRPIDIKEDEDNGVDLQLSGHTHRGQFFPNNLITKLIYEDDYGYLKKGKFNLIVSSGYGTWGPPIRIGTKGEIVNIKLKFNPK